MLTFEQLEPRCLLAASISFSNGLLTVTGDDNANGLFVHGAPPGVIVAGVDANNDGDFVDAGDVVRAVDFLDVRTIQIDAQHGDDVVLVHLDGTIPGDISILTRGGFDWVQVEHSDAGRDLNIDTGGAGDWIEVNDLKVGRRLNISTHGGVDLVGLNFVEVGDAPGSQVNLLTGAGDDLVSINGLLAAGSTSINLGRGQDLLLVNLPFLDVNPAQLSLNGGAGDRDALLTADGQAVQLITKAGAKVHGFERDEGLDAQTASTAGRLTAAGALYEFGADLIDEFHSRVDTLVLP